MNNSAAESRIRQSVRALLANAIDYAGLFPPAAVSMSEAVLNYAMYRNSNYNWMLGRFVVGVSRLAEFYESAADFISHDAVPPWRVAVVAGDDLYETIRIVENFNTAHAPRVICDTIEMKTVTAYQIETVAASVPRGVDVYFEIDPKENFDVLIAAVAVSGQCAKLRTGGIVPQAFPTSHQIVKFVQACMAANVPYKATAGLHHPIRCFRPLTYEENSVSGAMHGFLNLFLMTGLAREGYRRSILESVMEEESEEVFEFSQTEVKWRDEFELDLNAIEKLRTSGIRSFGSCSFDEPIADLQKLGIL